MDILQTKTVRKQRANEFKKRFIGGTQKDKVLEYLNWYGAITSDEAFWAFDCRRLAGVIHKLRKEGLKIGCVIHERCAVYFIDGE